MDKPKRPPPVVVTSTFRSAIELLDSFLDVPFFSGGGRGGPGARDHHRGEMRRRVQ